jgi:hypothetical protein
MIPRAQERADVLVEAARASCTLLLAALRAGTTDGAKLHASLELLGVTGTPYDEWGVTRCDEAPARSLFADPDALVAALEEPSYVALAVAPALLVTLDAAKAFELVSAALPLESTHFAPNYLEAYIQRGLLAVLDALQLAAPCSQIEAAFRLGRFVIEKIPAEMAKEIPLAAIADAVKSDALGYIHRDDVQAFLSVHPIADDLAGYTSLLEALGTSHTHAALAFRTALVDRLVRERYAPAAEVAARVRAGVDRDHHYGAQVSDPLRRLLFALRHRPTLEEEAGRLDALVANKELPFDPHHTIDELRAPLAAGFALDPEHASTRFAPFFALSAVESPHGAKVAHDILRAGQGLTTDHAGTVLGSGLGSFLDADPGWRELLAPLAKHKQLGRLVKGILKDLEPQKKTSARKTRK